ncbi:hypothetical protein HYDPIDRAFT_119308 [Hydnomerulius pinastri MD-312]|uniref:Uncharacterized protein n=1 Tax=Hydnomerulius pinastri MD-312 TaxID=994086 RepID=A0A0C9W7C4_9AGAM|nr:hypothetical protein HYDPIDRAFT_119308 [Hydnomerulius pinastri MD-312]
MEKRIVLVGLLAGWGAVVQRGGYLYPFTDLLRGPRTRRVLVVQENEENGRREWKAENKRPEKTKDSGVEEANRR